MIEKFQQEWIFTNIKKIMITSCIGKVGNVNYMKNDVKKHLDFYKDSNDLAESFLAFKYFDDIYQDEGINEDGSFENPNITLFTAITVFLQDGGAVTMTDVKSEEEPNLWYKDTKLTEEMEDIFSNYQRIEEEILVYLSDTYNDRFEYDTEGAYMDIEQWRKYV